MDRTEIIYHYTTQSGLIGILKSKCIWATHAAYLNDASEFILGQKIVQESLRGFTAENYFAGTEQKPSPRKIELANHILNSARRGLMVADDLDVFVASFFDSSSATAGGEGTDPGDVLNQWRAYSRGEPGFSIGFDKALMSAHVTRMKSDCGSCTYDEQWQTKYLRDRINVFGRSIIQDIFSFIANYALQVSPSQVEALRYSLEREVYSSDVVGFSGEFLAAMERELRRLDRNIIEQLADIMTHVAFMKHSGFAAENEWRIAHFLFRPDSGVKFRTSGSCVIPYVEIPLPLGEPGVNAIRRVVVGPSPKMPQAVRAAQMLLRCSGHKVKDEGVEYGVEVDPSKLPFRSW